MLDDADVASVATVEKPAARSPDTKAALQYLEASGARAISVTQGCGYVVIAVGFKPAVPSAMAPLNPCASATHGGTSGGGLAWRHGPAVSVPSALANSIRIPFI